MDFNEVLQKVNGTGAAVVITALVLAIAWIIVTLIKS